MNRRISVAVGALLCAWLAVGVAWGAKKKGGESCKKGDECETGVCKSGKCDPCPDRNNCPPPGTCTQDKHDGLKKKKDTACGKDRSCDPFAKFDDKKVDCNKLKALIGNGDECVKIRNEVMKECFKTGNDIHRKTRDEAADVLEECRALLKYKEGKKLCK